MDGTDKLWQDEIQAVTEHAQIVLDFYENLNEVNKTPLHDGQIQVARAFFEDKKRIIQGQWGRNGGKTQTIVVIAVLAALLYPGSHIYIICPQRKQGREIYWSSGRLKKAVPKKYIAGDPNKSELRLEFTNGSFICVDGCENLEGLRGIKPTLVFYDEFQLHSREFDLEIMRPNLLGKSASLIVMGTPPKRDCYYVEFRKALLDDIASGDASRFYLELPTEVNPAVDKEELKKTINSLIRRGDEAIAMREYYGKLIFGGEGSVFPYWSRDRFVRSHSLIMSLVEQDRTNLRWYTLLDPATQSCFGVLYLVYNPYTSQIYVLDEIYEKDRKKMSSVPMWEAIRKKELELWPQSKVRAWKRYCDEAAAWFMNEVHSSFKVPITPTSKHSSRAEDDISLIKDLMANEKILISSRCVKLCWEIENYVTDDNGELPIVDDHLIDCLRYGIKGCRFKFVEGVSRKESEVDDLDLSIHRSQVARVNLETNEDWTGNLGESRMSRDDYDLGEYFDA
ncbi:MAG: hypothetical protein E6Q97_36240 [Desulfurellales bacterium]|nr:MAG: hypothetical protein E6Q97_36240 [Desulfurellales bacterium]